MDRRTVECTPRALLVAVVLVAGSLSRGAPLRAQEIFDHNERAPRFLIASTTFSRPPARVDVSRTPVLLRRISVELIDVTLEQALNTIASKSGLEFAYSKTTAPLDRVVRLDARDITVAAALTEVLLDTKVDIVFSPRGRAMLVKRGEAWVQETGIVTGTVRQAQTNEVVVGAQVVVEGTRRGAITDADGRYRITGVPAGRQKVTATFLGLRRTTQEIEVADGATVTLDFEMAVAPTALSELVVTATGEQRRVELGHVVGRINADSLVKETPVSSLSELLTGRVSGVQVFQTQGTVGGQVSLQVRGLNSLSLSNQPIVVVDGVRYTNEERPVAFGFGLGGVEQSSPLNDINVNDIESIEVVKGPSAATLYGTDAANGVIVITTKRGQPGAARWDAYVRSTKTSVPEQRFQDIYWGWGTVNGVADNRSLSCTLARLATAQCTKQDSVTVLRNPLRDPQFSMLGNKPRWQYGMNVAGGQRDLRYYFSADFEDATGPVQMPPAMAEQLKQKLGLNELPEEWLEPNTFSKLNLRTNVTALLGDKADLRVTSGYIRSTTRTLPAAFEPYLTAHVGDTPASVSPYGDNSFHDPAQAFAQETSEQIDRFLGSASGSWHVTNWLSARATLGLDLSNSHKYVFVRPGDQPSSFFFTNGGVEDGRVRQMLTTADAGVTATARRGRLSARTALGAQYVRTLFDGSSSRGTGLPPGAKVVQRATTITTVQQHRESVVAGGYLEEVLGLNERLFLTGALRIDGASTFGRDFETALYPKVGASWLVTQEPFVPRVPGLDELRLRYAFGASGKQPDPAWARPLFAAGQMDLNGVRVTNLRISSLGNPNLGPERVREHEFGFDAGALGNRLALETTWFRRRTMDQLLIEAGPSGRGSQYTNLGLTTQHGFEAQVTARVLDARLLTWDVTLQHSNYTSKLVDIGRASMFRSTRGGYVEGFPLGARFVMPVVGWNDQNGDGIIVANEIQLGDTAVYAGQGIPPRTQTLTSTFGLLQGRLRVSALVDRKSGFTQANGLWCRSGRTCREAVDRNTPLSEQVKVLTAPGIPGVLEPGDFTRLREVTVALDIPSRALHSLRLRRGTVALSARNLALWTDFGGPDPEVGDVNPTGGIGYSPYVAGNAAESIPLGRSLSVRIDLGF